jgi:hypothetical protein
MERILETTKVEEQPISDDGRLLAYKVIDVLLIIGIIMKMVSLAVLMIEALSKWFREKEHNN